MNRPAKKQNPFKLRDFRGVSPAAIQTLAALGIKNAPQMLAASQSRAGRADLAARTGISPEEILELAKLSDLARLPGVKGIRARLYYAAGVDSVAKMAGWETEALLAHMAAYVAASGFEGTAPLPKEVSSTIANARRLPVVLET